MRCGYADAGADCVVTLTYAIQYSPHPGTPGSQESEPYEDKTGVIPVPGVIQEPGVNHAGNRRETYPKNRGESHRF
jgi:hypothetical protein